MANVICPNCAESYHTTTDAYRPGEVTTGNMLTLKKQYVDNGWTSFPEHEGMKFADLYCPGCGGALSSDGRVRIDEVQYAAEQQTSASFIIAMHKEEHLRHAVERKNFPGTEYAIAEPKEEKPETVEATMQRLMDEYSPELPEYHVQIEPAFFEAFKNGVYHKEAKRKPGRPKRV